MDIYELDTWFQTFLSISEFIHVDNSINGIQVSHRAENIMKICFSVDASLETFKRSQNANVLVVHHGLFWGREQSLQGYHYDRIRFLIENDIALYAIHLPLDAHQDVGNNYGMARALDLEQLSPFGILKDITIGVSGILRDSRSLFNIKETLFGSNVLQVLPFGQEQISSIAIVSGGGDMFIDEAIEKGIDLFITGDASHTIYHRCLEAKINVIFAGHYTSEVWGIKLLMQCFSEGPGAEQGVEVEFIDLPTGL